MINITVTGLEEEIAKLKATQLALDRGAVFAEAWTIYRMTLVPFARAEAPFRTGDVRDSIRTRVEGNTGILEATSDDAKYPHDGTSLQAPNPFLDRSVALSIAILEKLIATLIERRLK